MVKKRSSFLSYFSRSSSLSSESNDTDSPVSPRQTRRPSSFGRRRSESNNLDGQILSLRQENERLQQGKVYLESVVNALQSNEAGIMRLAKEQKLRDLEAEVDKLRQQIPIVSANICCICKTGGMYLYKFEPSHHFLHNFLGGNVVPWNVGRG